MTFHFTFSRIFESAGSYRGIRTLIGQSLRMSQLHIRFEHHTPNREGRKRRRLADEKNVQRSRHQHHYRWFGTRETNARSGNNHSAFYMGQYMDTKKQVLFTRAQNTITNTKDLQWLTSNGYYSVHFSTRGAAVITGQRHNNKGSRHYCSPCLCLFFFSSSRAFIVLQRVRSAWVRHKPWSLSLAEAFVAPWK